MEYDTLTMKFTLISSLWLYSIIAKHVATSVSGLAPRIMGIGPTYAIPAVLKRTGLTTEEVDLFEINEAFASMYVYCLEKLKLTT